ncbi:YiaA/YiaB family inner membrane protein [Streptomyces sp. DG1A-41]|uniref:YiaA/YiaB family inner membrane protein n=1 Tax=Streptomyces sp. DG1A-41 TaxID=3125779 RepID=UPI0030D3AC51
MSDTPGSKQQNTAAFYGQAVASFAVAMAATAIGIYQLSADAWVRGFLAIAVLYLVTSSFTLAKVIRDRQDGAAQGAAPSYTPFEKH